MIIRPVGDLALNAEFENVIDPSVNAQIRAFLSAVRDAHIDGIREYVPTYRSVTIHYDPSVIRYTALRTRLEQLTFTADEASAVQECIEIPVLYGGEAGPDLAFVAKHANLTEEEVIRIHSGTEYLVYMLGFTPGFPYLGGMDPRIAAPRLEKPRTAIPAGSVGIAGSQTGAYPSETPGGWQLIGRTPVKLYDPAAKDPFLLKAGASVRFRPIDRGEYDRIAGEVRT